MSYPALGAKVPVNWDGKQYQAIYLGQGQYQIPSGNNNGRASDALGWLVWAIQNKKAKAAASWATSSSLHNYDQAFTYAHGALLPLLEIVAVAAGGAAISFAAGGTAAAGAGAGAGAGAATGGTAIVAPTAEFTGTLAAPVTAVDTGLTVSTLAPITGFGGAVATAGSALGTAGSLAGSLLKPATALLGMAAKVKAAKAQAAAQAGTPPASPAPPPLASTPTIAAIVGGLAAIGLLFVAAAG